MSDMLEAKVLGKKVSHPMKYDPSVLVAIPRSYNRTIYGIEEEALPFCGMDAWHAYEVSFLTDNGVPVVGVLKMVVPADSPCLVESKSLKLYLNSFNMSSFGATRKEGLEEVTSLIKKDISSLLSVDVEVTFHTKDRFNAFPFKSYERVEEMVDLDSLVITDYTENKDLLEVVTTSRRTESEWKTDLLRSNCKVTFQPDWGSVYLYIEGTQHVTPESFLKYVVSLRNENHFHEEICELLYVRLKALLNPDKLMVGCVYTRRGGIDICPFRASHKELLPASYVSASKLVEKNMRQ